MQRSKNENLFENWHPGQRKVETHLRCVARPARDRPGGATGAMPRSQRAALGHAACLLRLGEAAKMLLSFTVKWCVDNK